MCGCKKRSTAQFVWTGTNANGETTTITYNTEIEARAKVIRSGGTYTRKEN